MEDRTRPRLIDVNRVRRYAVEIDDHLYVPWVVLAEIPTAGVPSRWVKKELGQIDARHCFRCGFGVRKKCKLYRYCPNCGTRMDGGEPDAQT